MKRRLPSDEGPRKVQAFNREEQNEVDVLRIPQLPHLYAFIDKIEIEKTTQGARLYHINFHCMNAGWFDRLAEDLSDMPPVNTIAQDAGSCLVELTTSATVLERIKDGLNVPHIQEDWWVALVMADQPNEPYVEVVVYPPAAGSDNPATIGTTGNSRIGYLRRIERVRPPRTLAKLQRFSHNSDI